MRRESNEKTAARKKEAEEPAAEEQIVGKIEMDLTNAENGNERTDENDAVSGGTGGQTDHEAGPDLQHGQHDPPGGEERMNDIEIMRAASMERIQLNRQKAIENAKNAVIKVKKRRTDRFTQQVQMNDTDMLLYSIANSLLAIAQGMK